jgi:O-6-methylguanine DNA methyltransferase
VLAEKLRASASRDVPDPLFRESLRARLVEPRSAVRYAVLETPIGSLWLAYEGDTLRMLSTGDESDFLARAQAVLRCLPSRDPAAPSRLARRVLAAIGGKRPYEGQLDLSPLTDFQRAVLEQARRIPRGQVRSYGWIAREIGHPRAVRAVGTALARNPLPFVIPCHRVIRGDGDLGQYSGGGEGTKERILTFEGVDVSQLRDLAARGLRFRGSRNTRIFCLPTCHSHKWAREQNTIYFHTADEAFAAGFRPCKFCRPAAPASA